MYAIVDIQGQQFKVEKDQKVFVNRLEGEAGNTLSFDKVLLVDNNGKIAVGEPTVKNASVDAEIISHLKGDTIQVFKKKRRKGYRKLNGHRQYLTEILIKDIKTKAAAKKAAPKTQEVTEEAPKAEDTKAE